MHVKAKCGPTIAASFSVCLQQAQLHICELWKCASSGGLPTHRSKFEISLFPVAMQLCHIYTISSILSTLPAGHLSRLLVLPWLGQIWNQQQWALWVYTFGDGAGVWDDSQHSHSRSMCQNSADLCHELSEHST